MAAKGVGTVPVFKLYGETVAWPTPDLIHCESIPERSRLHDWEIRPHRHSDLVQVLYVQSGRALLQIEDRVREVEGPVLQVVPALSVHAFRFAADIQGHILTLALPLVEQLEAALDGLGLGRAQCIAPGEDGRMLESLFNAVVAEYHQSRAGRELMLQALITQLLVWLCRRSAGAEEVEEPTLPDRGREHMQRFMHQLEESFRLHWPIEEHARRLGISAAHLNALCRRLSDQSALQIINQRLLLEAKRNLVYTTLTVNQVSDSLGFSEPAYFTRFFKRTAGVSPRQFRQQR